jgi:hypothetical protein
LAAKRLLAKELKRTEPIAVTSSTEIRTLTTPQDLFAAAAEEVVRAANQP